MATFLEIAREQLVERLHDGKTVHLLTLQDLIDADLSGSRSGFAIIEVCTLLMSDSGEVAAKRDRYLEGVIERFLESKPELVRELAEELAAEGPDECDLSRDAAMARD